MIIIWAGKCQYIGISLPKLRSCRRDSRLGALVVFVVAGEVDGEAVDGGFVFGVEVDEGAEFFGEPGEGEVFLASAVGEFFQAAVGEVHQVKAFSMIWRCSISWTLEEPAEGADIMRRETRVRRGSSGKSSGRCRP